MFARMLRRSPASRVARNRKQHLTVDTLEGRQLMSLGAEFVIAPPVSGSAQIQGANASSSNGASIAVWQQTSNTSSKIEGQLFNAQGGKVGPILTLASGSGVTDQQPSAAMDAHGNFVVSWTEVFANNHTNILAQKFSSTGAPLGAVVPVAVGTFQQTNSSVAMDAKGDFVVSYTRDTNNDHFDIFAKLYNTNGQLEAVDNAADGTLPGDFSNVAMTPDGRFDVAWLANPNATSNFVEVDQYTASGTLIDNRQIASGFNGAPQIAVDNQGNAVVVYDSETPNAAQIQARRLSDTGAVGGVINITSRSSADPNTPTVALEGSGGAFVVAYEVGNGSGLNVSEVNGSNAVIGTFSTGPSRVNPAISINGQNEFLVSYNVVSNGQTIIDGRRGQL